LIEETVISLARAVFARRGRLLFGGHPSISPLVASIAAEYYEADPSRDDRPVVAVQSELYRNRLPDETWLMSRMGWAEIVWTPKVEGRDEAGTQARSLRRMRADMLSVSMGIRRCPPAVAMVAVGGMDGVRDEAIAFLEDTRRWPPEARPRVFTFPSGGGAAARLARPMTEYREQLWPGGEADAGALGVLKAGAHKGSIVDIESEWSRCVSIDGVPQLETPPLGVISEWMLDNWINAEAAR
jgi:hypothetical protein